MDDEFTFKKHPVWEVFQNAKSFSLFKKSYLAGTTLNESVPEGIREQFFTVVKLIEYSYFEYCFLDAATNKALQIFELTLKLKLKDLGVKIPKTLFEIIDQITDQFSIINPNILNSLRKIRNHYAHPVGNQVGGVVMIQIIPSIVEVINELYPLNLITK